MKKKGFTLIELLVVIAIIAMLLAILMPALSKVKKIAQRVICGTNLKGLGTAQTVYANDYDDEYTVQGQGGAHVWTDKTDNWFSTTKNWGTGAGITVGASLFLLVREADVSPKSFICGGSDQKEWDAKTAAPGAANPPDITQVWDFGGNTAAENNQGPDNCVSYSYHQPYKANGVGAGTTTGSKSTNAADGSRSAAFAVMADKNPWFDKKLTNIQYVDATNYLTQIGLLKAITWTGTAYQRYEVLGSNAYPHGREGQNVAYGDGHSAYEQRSDVGEQNDNIYTWISPRTNATTEESRRMGMFNPTRNDAYPSNSRDSMLVNDDMQIQ